MNTKIKLVLLVLLIVVTMGTVGFLVAQIIFSQKEAVTADEKTTEQDIEEGDTEGKGTKEKNTKDHDVPGKEVEEAYVPTEEERLEKEIDSIIFGMTTEEKVAQLFVITPEALTGYETVIRAGDVTRDAFNDYPVGGIILFAQNLTDVSQVKQMNENLQGFSDERLGIPLLIGVDEEGGQVARCADVLGTTSFSPMYDYKGQGVPVARSNAATIASDIAGLGFTADFAPVADTWSNSANTVIGSRAYSDDYEESAELVAAAVEGFHDGGVDCTLKHYPGHGNTLEDSHEGSAYSDKSLEQLLEEDLLAFKSGINAGADMVMAGHITMTSIDGLPASLSHTMLSDVLRGDLGFDGVVITDSLAMGAVADNYGSAEACIKAINAGADMLMMPKDFSSAYNGVLSAVEDGRISTERIDESLKRILRMKLNN